MAHYKIHITRASPLIPPTIRPAHPARRMYRFIKYICYLRQGTRYPFARNSHLPTGIYQEKHIPNIRPSKYINPRFARSRVSLLLTPKCYWRVGGEHMVMGWTTTICVLLSHAAFDLHFWQLSGAADRARGGAPGKGSDWKANGERLELAVFKMVCIMRPFRGRTRFNADVIACARARRWRICGNCLINEFVCA